MKIFVLCAAGMLALALIAASSTSLDRVSAQESRKIPDVLTLATEAKLGSVRFNHTDHVTKNYSIEGATVACIECHHTAQPAAEVIKHPPMKTAFPADRTTTLTADLFTKDPSAAGVAACRDCHARANTKPKLLPEIPQIKLEVGTELVTLNNQQAFHRNCAGCHDEIVKTNKDLNPPTSMKCIACHKRA
ncbi:MAG TPA: cytochrome c3 family protein [Pyrinomonadaceae bacterium]|nr:cytochrome c3 family protein [Pyrinomonadaceae bacterium]